MTRDQKPVPSRLYVVHKQGIATYTVEEFYGYRTLDETIRWCDSAVVYEYVLVRKLKVQRGGPSVEEVA